MNKVKTSDLNFFVENQSDIVYGAASEYILKNEIRTKDWSEVLSNICAHINLGGFKQEWFKESKIRKSINSVAPHKDIDKFMGKLSSSPPITEQKVTFCVADWIVKANINAVRIKACKNDTGREKSMRRLLSNTSKKLEIYTKSNIPLSNTVIDNAIKYMGYKNNKAPNSKPKKKYRP